MDLGEELRNVVTHAGEDHAPREPQLDGVALERRALGTVAGDQEAPVGKAPREMNRGLQEVRDAFHLGRNDYDRIGHFAQGFVPAIAAREILIRRNVVRGRGWRYFIIVTICLAISAAYELLEWRVSVATGSSGDAFLGTQGDVWDTQEDMATALIAALVAPLLLGRLHDRQLARLAAGSGSHGSP